MIDIRKFASRALKTIFVVVGLLLPFETLFANPIDCNRDLTPFRSTIISYDTNPVNTYCELCGVGQIRIVVSNPVHEDMVNIEVKHNFTSNEFEYVLGSTIINGTPTAVDPGITGGGTTLTWNQIDFPALTKIDGVNDHSSSNSVEIIFQVKSTSGDEENLVNLNNVDKSIQASADFELCELPLTPVANSLLSDSIILPVREPIPTVNKLGRNYDAAQDQNNYTQNVYGNINDDVIWRIQINNGGLAGLQDLRFDDVMGGANFDVNYICPDESDADALASSNGTVPGNCVAFTNSELDYSVANPFGDMGTSVDGYEVDVLPNGNAQIFLVGKITSSCNADSTNTVSDIQWGCAVEGNAGGITHTSLDPNPIADAEAYLESLVENPNTNLDIRSNLSGLNGSQPVGSRGLMTITVTNNTGGTVRDIVLTNALPAQYAVDQTFVPRITVTPAYGNVYRGMADTLEPLVPTALPENFKTPVFILTSNGDANPNNADQINMLRHADIAVIEYRVVMVQADHFDNEADIDLPEEVVGDNDPDNIHNTTTAPTDLLSTDIDATYKHFCDLNEFPIPSIPTITETHDSWPEDLDIDLPGALNSAFILTNDPNQLLRLEVEVRNRGGHNADDYHVYVTFGSTMFPAFVPHPNWNCAVTSNPPPLEVWEDPEDIPATATVYDCNRGTISPGAIERFYFDVRKVQDTDPNGVNRLNDDDLTFRADVIGEVRLSDNTSTGSGALLTFPTVPVAPINNRANNYSLDSYRAKVIGFNLTKTQPTNLSNEYYCSENKNPLPAEPDEFVEIGEECRFHIETGGWFGFQTPGFTLIAVKNIRVEDQLPDGQGFISTSVPAAPILPSDEDIDGIKSITITPPAPLAEGTFNWQFNWGAGEEIKVKDKWFRMDARTRILNNLTLPNVHAATSSNVLVSSFDAVFDLQTITLDDNAVGYPNVASRTVDLTITEPNILVTKEVCNETLSIIANAANSGENCTPFATTVTNGDTQDEYVYRVTLTNEASNSGVSRAPAYNITATDTLDASDLVLIKSFATDNLDNDGDGLVDGADASESTISDNIISNATPAVITTSHTHSDALLKIDAGSSVMYYYRVDPDDAVAPLQQLVNNVDTTYDSLEGDFGAQTTLPAPFGDSSNSETGGARVYNSTTASATVQILPLQTQPKEITRLSNTTIGGTPQAVSIGEEIEYQLRTSIPVANLRSFKIRDELPAGISCVEAPVVNLNADGPHADAGFDPGGLITPTCTNNLVEWDFGDQELTDASGNALFDFKILFIARVNNSAGVNNADVISNGDPTTNVVMSYINEASALVTQTFNEFSIVVQEPNVVLTKTYEAGNHDASNVITVTVTAENTGTANAYNLRVLDDLDAVSHLTFQGNVVGNTGPPLTVAPQVSLALGANRPVFSWLTSDANYEIEPGEIITFKFDISVDIGAEPLEVLDNTIQASWQSLPEQTTSLNTSGSIGVDGSATGMRNGAIPNVGDVLNDYETTANTSSTVPAVTVTKTDLDPTQAPEVGVHKNYEIVINLPEGTTNNLVVNDNLNFADISYVLENNATYDIDITFTGIASINNGLAPSEANLISPAPVDGAQNTVTWNFGKVVTLTEDDTSVVNISPSITINYYARINNDLITNSGSTLQNQVTTNYQNGETPATTEALVDDTPELTVTESDLAVTKVATLQTPAPITGGDIIEYVITVTNSGNATAYDVNIVDTLPSNLSLYSPVFYTPGFTPTADIGGAVGGFDDTPLNSPNGPLIWGRGNTSNVTNADNSLDIPAGSSLILTYQVIVDAGAESNLDYINSVVVDWTSLDNTITNSATYERTGAGAGVDCSAIVAPNDYCVGPITSTVTTDDTNTLVKSITADTDTATAIGTVRIGDEVTYQLSLNLQEGTTRNVNVQDVLPTGLEFVKIISINYDTVADYNPPGSGDGSNFSYSTVTAASLPAAGATGTINFTLGNVVNDPLGDSTTDTLVIEYQARVLNDTLLETPTTQTLTNTATLQYIDGNGAAVVAPARLERSATLTVLQPELIVTKTEGAALVQIGTPISYTINVLNTGDSPAYNLTVTDVLPTFDPADGGMCDNTPTITSVGIYDNIGPTLITALAPGTDYIVNYSGCTLTLTMQSTAVLAADNNLIITYDAQLDADTPHTSVLTNIAGATQWFSQDTASATSEIQSYTKTLTDGTTSTADHEDASTVTSGTPTVTVEKQVFNVTTNQIGTTATPGDTLRYTINITNTSSFELFNFSFTDELDDLNASAWFAANTLNLTSVPAGADITNTDAAGGAKGTGLVDVRNLTLGIGTIPGDDTVVIVFEVNLAPSIPDGTTVLNQGHMITNGLDFLTDDPNIGGLTDPTETLISSAPLFKVEKTSTDLTDDPNILLSGDTLRYTIKVKNIGTEDTINSILRDQLPANTTYVAGSTMLNGNAVTEPVPSTLPLQAGIPINTPVNTTAGYMVADGTGTDLTIGAVATIIFDVTINNSVVNGTIISNQGYVSADGIATGAIADTPSDDPGTPLILNDPTRNVVGNQPLLDAHKTASISVDINGNGYLDIGDEIRYTIAITNSGAAPATGVSFTDAVPANTTYIADSVTLNTFPVAQPDLGTSPLIAGIPVSSSDLTLPLPTAGNGIINVGQTAVITFDVRYNLVPPVVKYISNQGFVYSNEQPVEPTDADGIDSNGDQPTLIAIGNEQLLSISKTVSVVGGGPALAGGQLEYRVLVTNISGVDATNVTITDNLDLPVAGQLTYVAGSGLLNGLPTGVDVTALPIITADYYTPYGDLLPGQTAELVFRVLINNALPLGTTITNIADVTWDAGGRTASASVSIDVGGTPGSANVSGRLWHDKDYDDEYDAGEILLSGWYVDIYRDTTLIGTVTSDANGYYNIDGLIPNYIGPERYDIRFRAPGSNATTAKLGLAARGILLPPTVPPFIYDLHRIYDIVLNSGASIQELNLPIDPNGVVYNSVTRTAIPGATISLLNAGTGSLLSSSCFDDANQQEQVTTANGYYKFDLNFTQADCIAGGNYLIRITPPATDYSLLPSTVITPQTDVTTAALDVPNCPGTADDDVAAPAGYCEVQVSELAPSLAVAPASAGTSYYLHITLNDVDVPGDSQIFNNHLPIDPVLTNAVAITKTSAFINVTRGKLVPYTITFTNNYGLDFNNASIIDNFPAGFKYIAGSARYNNGTTEVQREPVRNGLQLTWANIDLPVGQIQSIKMLLIVGAGVKEGPYINKVYVFDTLTNSSASGTATATVRVVADPDFDCTHVIGKVFDDKNLNGYQDEKESGLPGVKLVTVNGLVSTSDKHGRFHVTCAVVPNEDRGTNFIIKLDERTLPSGYRMTTENPRVQRATRGKMLKFNFGSALHRVVSMDLADGVFISNSTEMNSQWVPRIDLLIKHLKVKPSVLRLSYLADVDDESIVEDRLKKVKQDIIDKWLVNEKYKLTIETEIFWRRGEPPDRGGID